MSNSAVGATYDKIINETISASKLDFAEDGVPESVLNQLLEKWQNRISSNRVAVLPWDPAPPTVTAAAAVTNNPEPTHAFHAPPAASPPQPSLPPPAQHIKQEPGYESNNAYVPRLPQNNGYPNAGLNTQLANQRAQALLQQKFGNQAEGSLAAMQAANAGMPGQQQSQGLQLPQMANQSNPQVKVQKNSPSGSQQQSTLPLAQTDGSSDARAQWTAVLTNRNSEPDDGPRGRHAVDGFMRAQVLEMSMRLEGGGLLETLEERERRFGKRRRVDKPAQASSSEQTSREPSRYDGGDSDEEKPFVDDDDDAINSDLDDPNDLGDGDEEIDIEMGDYVLCTYDKVQRVKNKWKCTLKDGVLHADGKDYVFHKAQGEFEW